MDSTELNSKVELPAETLAILADISQEINSSLNLDEVLATAAAQIKRLIDYEIFAVLLPEENTRSALFSLRHRASPGSGRALAHSDGRGNHRRRRRHRPADPRRRRYERQALSERCGRRGSLRARCAADRPADA